MSHRLQAELMQRACERVSGRVPVLVAISDTSLVESLRMANAAAAAGADGLVLAPPYYFLPSQSDLLRHVERVHAAISLPLFLYNMPGLTKVAWEPETVRKASKLPGVVGLKDSSGDMDYLRAVIEAVKDRADFTVLVGPEGLLVEAMRAGAHGGVCGGANLMPALLVSEYRAAAAGNWAEAERISEIVKELGRAMYGTGDPGSSYLRGLKCALSGRGICRADPAPPFSVFSEEEAGRIAEGLGRFERAG